jgi:dGTPase
MSRRRARQAAPLIGFSASMRGDSLELKRFLREHLYRHEQVVRMTRKADRIIELLFTAYMEDIRLLPAEHQAQARRFAERNRARQGAPARWPTTSPA